MVHTLSSVKQPTCLSPKIKSGLAQPTLSNPKVFLPSGIVDLDFVVFFLLKQHKSTEPLPLKRYVLFVFHFDSQPATPKIKSFVFFNDNKSPR